MATRTESTVRYNYRLRVSASAGKALLSEWDRCRWVWNQCVASSHAAHLANEECGPARLDKMLTRWRTEHPWLGEGSSVTQQQTVRDFGRARAKALSDIKARLPMSRRRGMPRFKRKAEALPSMNYTKRGFSVREDKLFLAGGTALGVVWSRELPSEPSSVRVYKDPVGHWYASFVVRAEAESLAPTGRAIGVDWGVTETATTTEAGFGLPHAQHGKRAASRLAHYQRQMARRRPKPGQRSSAGYRKARAGAAKAYRKVADRRKDDARKWAKKIVREFDQLAVEDFKPKFLSRSTMARKAADAAIAGAKAELLHMAKKHCRDLRLVAPAYTTMDCSSCGARAKHRLLLSERNYVCESCGTTKSRDRNSAFVMLNRAGFTPAGADRVRLECPQGTRAA